MNTPFQAGMDVEGLWILITLDLDLDPDENL